MKLLHYDESCRQESVCFFNDTATTEIYTLSLHDALPIFARALLTGKPFLWHIYPQKNGLHFQKLQSFLEKYCPDNLALQKSFYSYNKEETDYFYFWEHLTEIQKHNEEFRDYIRKHCNLGIKLKQFIENF